MEPVLPLSIVLSVIGGAFSAFLTLNKKFEGIEDSQQKHLLSVDNRIDSIELRLAKEYVDKDDLTMILKRLDDRIDRMDYKLDRILIGYNKSATAE